MALLDRLKEFNNVDYNNFYNFYYKNNHIGYVSKKNAENLVLWFKNQLIIDNNNIKITDKYNSFETVSKLFEDIANELLTKNLISNITYEYFPVTPLENEVNLFKIDRSLIPIFGIKAKGIHLNGYVYKNKELHIWVAIRSKNKLLYPGKLDNIAAGAVSYGFGSWRTLIKEAYEEASIDENLVVKSQIGDCFGYKHVYNNNLFMRNDIIFTYDLEIPERFIPCPNDGEVEKFKLMPATEVLEILTNSDDFKFNSAIVFINFLLRQRIINPEEHNEINEFFYKNRVKSGG